MKAVLFGATRGMGRALARLLAERGEHLYLLGRNDAELERSAADLRARSPNEVAVRFHRCDLGDPDGHAAALAAGDEALGGLDTVIVAAACFATAEQCENDPSRAAELLTVNFANTILFCEHARRLLLRGGGGTLCVFGSVAGDRARKPTFLYGAAKAGLSHYLECLDLRYRDAGLVTVCVKPGFVRTTMTAGLKAPPFAGDPLPVARRVLRAIDAGKPVVYAPKAWRGIMLVIRCLPRWLMRRLHF